MTLAAGSKLSFYEVLAPIGAGAMGEGYRARDTRLDREVAIKVVPEHFADDAERLKRYEREAKTLATLDLDGWASDVAAQPLQALAIVGRDPDLGVQRETFDVAAQLAGHEERAIITTAPANPLDRGAALRAKRDATLDRRHGGR